MSWGPRSRRRPPAEPPLPDLGPHRMPWWATPAGICLGFLLPVLVLIAYAGEIRHPAFTVRGIRFLTAPYLLLAAALLVISALGGWIGQHIVARRAPVVDGADLLRAANVMGCLGLLIYCLWLGQYLFNPVVVFGVLTGEVRPSRTELGTAGGVRSLLNFTLIFYCFAAYAIFALRQRPDRLCRFLIVALTFLTLYRSYLWSERLAFIEIVVPSALAWMLVRPRRLAWAWAPVRRLGPFAGIPFVIGFFAATEYLRSWQSDYYNNGKLGFFDFAIGRFASYYYTSLNNGAGILATDVWPTYTYDSILQWMHKMPAGIGSMFKAVTELRQTVGGTFLSEYGDPEFNNLSGLLLVVSDIGVAGAAVYFFVIAFVAAMLMRRYERANIIGIALFPCFFMSFIEIFRYPYLGQTRAFSYVMAALIGVAVVYYFQRRRERRLRAVERAQRFGGLPAGQRA
jgi:oligosaccharide repeat unit polymerase